MELTINSQQHSATLQRTVVQATATFTTETTPSRAALKDAVAKKLKADAAAVVVRTINGGFGNTRVSFVAAVYDTPALVAKYESKTIIEKNNPKPKAAAA